MLVAAVVADTNYCTIESCDDPQEQTMCMYPNDGPVSSCGTVTERRVPDDDQAEILLAHNTIRQDVKNGVYADKNLPAALEMPDLVWDDELAAVAQRWVDQCLSGHDKCQNVPRFKVGQNYHASWGYPKDWTANAVGAWFFDELPLFQQDDLTYVGGQGTGHLTQVIWAKTTHIGCGYIALEDAEIWPPYVLTKRTYVCNYGPAGNLVENNIGKQIYPSA